MKFADKLLDSARAEFLILALAGLQIGTAVPVAGELFLRQDLVRTSLERPVSQPLGADSSFARMLVELSEPGGYFDTDNLISNETSYLHVVGAMDRLGISGGAYIGVGPGQNFSYIAAVRPEIAFIVDIRRDNQLQHLLFKALFQLSDSRVEYLAIWLGKPVPERPGGWADATVDEIVSALAETPASPQAAAEARMSVRNVLLSWSVPFPEGGLQAIDRMHAAFIRSGFDLRFTSFNRPPQWYYPTLGQLLTETDLDGKKANYLNSEDDFLFLKELQEQHRIIPVIGDLAGGHALEAVGNVIDSLGLEISVLYASNVEFYLWQDRSFDKYVSNMGSLPWSDDAVIIRSYFSGLQPHPMRVENYYSSQLLQSVEGFMTRVQGGGYRDYWDMVTDGVIRLR